MVDVRFQLRAGAVAGLLVLALTPVPVAAQGIPDEFTNLELLPDDISRREITSVMRGFTRALDVRCSYCHMVSDDLESADDDFASDDKETKVAARLMMTMVAAINGDHLHELPHEHAPAAAEHDEGAEEHEHAEPEPAEHEHEEGVEEHEDEAAEPVATASAAAQHREVSCVTCHSGMTRPATLVQELTWAEQDGGLDALQARYNELRDEYFGRGAYDFGARSLVDVAQALVRDDADAAMTVVDLNLQHHPESVPTWNLKGQIHAFEDRTDQAIEAYEKSLQIAPNDEQATEALERLRSGGP